MLDSLRLQVERHIGERAYTSVYLLHMMENAGLQRRPSDTTVRRYAVEQNLGVTPEELGIVCSDPKKGKAYFIRSSNLPALIQGLGLPITPERLEQASCGY